MSKRKEAKGAVYPATGPARFEVRNGKWGAYFRDTKSGVDLPLNMVCAELNLHELRKLQLRWYVDKYGEQK